MRIILIKLSELNTFVHLNDMQRRYFLASTGSTLAIAACGGGSSSTGSGNVGSVPAAQNRSVQENLAASNDSYKAKFTLRDMVSAWGVAIRPAEAGGHFWVGAGGSSWQFVGDVRSHANPALRSLTVDALTRINPNVGAASPVDATRVGNVTGVAYCGTPLWGGSVAATNFVTDATRSDPVFGKPDAVTGITPAAPQVMRENGVDVVIEGGTRFAFVSDTGVLSAWSERRQDTGGVLRLNGKAQTIYDGGTNDGSAYFGVAFKPVTFDKLWVADFGASPQIRQFDAQWNLEPTAGFANPFGTGAGSAAKPGDFVPFNIHTVGSRVFVTYAKSRVSDTDVNAFFAGEEDSLDADAEKASGFQPDRGRLVEYDTSGQLVRIYKDDKHLNAPWGVEIAPASFGAFAGAVLVGNFGGAGYITAFDGATGAFLGYLRGTDSGFIAIAGLWGLQFGNGASLGDADALYFAAGPEGAEPAGLFGSLRYTPK